ncbi:hypothetical protein M426DRAFT_172805 [Hypoxylon sp. CI-4A]|nr:hypothetical protein M426DRAFT_172805 [Hypoxylon sp. CI-4A]
MDSSASSANLAHDQRVGTLVGVVCLVCTVATVAVGFRFYTRSCMLKQLGADDYLVFIAWAFAVATGVSQCTNTRNGLGKHVWDLGSDVQLEKYLKGFYVSITLYNTGLMFIKLAFLMQYYRVLAIRKMRRILISAMVVIGCWSLSQVIVGIFICDPVSGFWEKATNPKCIPNYPQWYINAAGNIATDIAIFLLPLPFLGHLHLPKAQRLVLIGIFSLGFFTCAISVIRVQFLQQGGDFSYENVVGSSWSVAELCSGVTCACLPTLRPLVSMWVPSLSNRLHKPARGCRRRSAFSGGDAARGSRHIRGNSDMSGMLDMGSREDFYCIGIEARLSDSEDGSKDSSELGEKREIVFSRGTASPTPPACAHMAVHTPYRPAGYFKWMESSVTTDIGTGSGGKRPQHVSSTTIQVQRDVTVHKM